MVYLIIGLAGVCGALLRYMAGLLVTHAGLASVWATLPVNLSGCFLLGAFNCYGETVRPELHPWIKAAIGTGFLGAYTTFSTFSLESMNLLRSGQYMPASLYFLASLWGGLAAAWVGWSIVTRMRRNRPVREAKQT